MPDTNLHAVLTGDIVDSSRIPPRQLHALFATIRKELPTLCRAADTKLLGTFSVTQGDRCQFVLNDARYALRFMAFVSAITRAEKITMRLSAGLGVIDKPLRKNTTESTGEAFTLSGRGLAELEKSTYKKRYWMIDGQHIGPYQKQLVTLLGDIAAKWTPVQAEVIRPAALNRSQDEIAAKFSITRQGVAKRLAGARWDFFATAMKDATP